MATAKGEGGFVEKQTLKASDEHANLGGDLEEIHDAGGINELVLHHIEPA